MQTIRRIDENALFRENLQTFCFILKLIAFTQLKYTFLISLFYLKQSKIEYPVDVIISYRILDAFILFVSVKGRIETYNVQIFYRININFKIFRLSKVEIKNKLKASGFKFKILKQDRYF